MQRLLRGSSSCKIQIRPFCSVRCGCSNVGPHRHRALHPRPQNLGKTLAWRPLLFSNIPPMALLKTLRSLVRNPNTRYRPCFHCSESLSHPSPLQFLFPTSPASPALSLSLILRLNSSHPMLFPPLLRGPLFLSSPAWKLSQSATPLYLRGREAIFPNDLLVRRIPIELRFGSAGRGVETQAPDRDLPRLRVDDTVLNLPNWISLSRMLSGPLIGWMIINEWYVPAFCGLVIAGITDWLDGFLARKMNINSVFGSYLDPLADKVLIGCVALAMVEKGLLHPGLVFLVVLRDVGLVGGAVYRRASSLGWELKSWSNFVNLDATHQEKVEPLFISKVNTVFQLLLIAAALLQPEFGSEDTQRYITYLSWLVASTTVVSAVGYGAHLRHKSVSAREKWLSR